MDVLLDWSQLSPEDRASLLNHNNPSIRQWAEQEYAQETRERPIGRDAIETFDRRGPDREATEHRERLRGAEERLRALPLTDEARARIGQLLEWLPSREPFCDGPEAEEVAKLVLPIFEHDHLLTLLRQAEGAGRLYGGVVDRLVDTWRHHNPYIALLNQLVHELRLGALSPDIRKEWPGRPSAYIWAVAADCIADELRGIAEDRWWPIVADLLGPFLAAVGDPVRSDAEHLRQLVDHGKRVTQKRLDAGEALESWEQQKASLLRKIGIRPTLPETEPPGGAFDPAALSAGVRVQAAHRLPRGYEVHGLVDGHPRSFFVSHGACPPPDSEEFVPWAARRLALTPGPTETPDPPR